MTKWLYLLTDYILRRYSGNAFLNYMKYLSFSALLGLLWVSVKAAWASSENVRHLAARRVLTGSGASQISEGRANSVPSPQLYLICRLCSWRTTRTILERAAKLPVAAARGRLESWNRLSAQSSSPHKCRSCCLTTDLFLMLRSTRCSLPLSSSHLPQDATSLLLPDWLTSSHFLFIILINNWRAVAWIGFLSLPPPAWKSDWITSCESSPSCVRNALSGSRCAAPGQTTDCRLMRTFCRFRQVCGRERVWLLRRRARDSSAQTAGWACHCFGELAGDM